ncbi:MAG: (Fe-S)-binding protein [Solirubrobacterales bacterium]
MLRLEDYADLIQKCSACGYCQAACPVFKEEVVETLLPRARVRLIREVFLDETHPVTPRVKEILDLCLLCTNCTQNCSSSVPCDEVMTAARIRHWEKESGLGGAAKKFVFKNILNQRGAAGLLTRAAHLAQKLNLGPKDVPVMAAKPFDSMVKGTIAAIGERRARAAYFVGCGTNYMFPDTGEAVVRALTANGVEVVIPDGQVCCGIPALAEGDIETARESVRTNIDRLAAVQADAVVTDCTSCGMMFGLKAAKLFEADDPIQVKIAEVAGKLKEATDYLDALGLSREPGPISIRYTYHVPCHRGWSSTVENAPRHLLGMIPGLEAVEMEDPKACCGAAGTFYLEHKNLSERIRSHKLEDIQSTGAEMVVTQCPVCRFYLQARLEGMSVVHPMALVARVLGEANAAVAAAK